MSLYAVQRNTKYDYNGQSYSTMYPNLHKYPATMIPQIGIDLLKELKISQGNMLDPYCGSGSSFICCLEQGITNMTGFDINPLAILISKAKFTKLNLTEVDKTYHNLQKLISQTIKEDKENIKLPEITNIDFWFLKPVIKDLAIIKYCIDHTDDEKIKNLFFVPFSETVKVCSNSRTDEFKLVRKKASKAENSPPNVFGYYLKRLNEVINLYKYYYYPKVKNIAKIDIFSKAYYNNGEYFDLVLTSPPYGDSKTTVAYGQFSTLANEWLGISSARKIDSQLMGGKSVKEIIKKGIISESIAQIEKIDKKRALEVSAFYVDLEESIRSVSKNVNTNGKIIYIVGNRTVKGISLPTDQFIAEKFIENGFKHIITYQRSISNKVMPSKNSPTNKTGETLNTMLYEYIVICEKNA